MIGRFMYYVPKLVGVTLDGAYEKLMERLGLWGALEGTTYESRGVDNGGPDGGSGVILAPYVRGREHNKNDHAVGYHPETQTWFPREDKEVWIGFYNEAKPGPDDLRRDKMLPGHTVTLADGSEWACAMLYNADGSTAVPHVFSLDPQTGQDALVVPERLRQISERIGEFRDPTIDLMFAQKAPAMTYSELFDLACSVLQITYHVGAWEVKALGVFDQQNLWGVCMAAIDWPGIIKIVSSPEFKQSTNDG